MPNFYPLPIVDASSEADNQIYVGLPLIDDTLNYGLFPDRFNLGLSLETSTFSVYDTDASRTVARAIIYDTVRSDSASLMDNLVGGAGGDLLIGDSDDNILVGLGADFSENHGTGGAFNPLGGVSRAASGLQSTNVQHNRLEGGGGDDMLLGDMRIGEGAFDRLFGGDGEDTLDGGIGRGDEYSGGGGSDVFLFDLSSGDYKIMDFENNNDMVVIARAPGVDEFGDLSVEQDGDHARVTFADTQITFRNQLASELDVGDFVFL